MAENTTKFLPGRGLDCGTGTLIAAQMTEAGDIYTKIVRDSFLEMKPANKLVFNTMKKSLSKSGINFFETEDSFIVLGDDALLQSVERQLVIQRPMSKGVISPKESKALPMFKALIKELLGEPTEKGEKVIFSVPASPSDAPFDIEYHKNVIITILRSLGYDGRPVNEAHAIVLSELGEEDEYTGITISYGAGMANVCIANMADIAATFAISKGGDYIDYSAAVSLGFDPSDPKGSEITPNLITYIKEQGIDILNPDEKDKVQVAISAYYRVLIKYSVNSIIAEVNKLQSKPKFMKPIKVVVSGGTSLAKGFIEVFEEELNRVKDQLPFGIKQVVKANKQVTSVAEGALLALLSES
jgi:hypothetical protein